MNKIVAFALTATAAVAVTAAGATPAFAQAVVVPSGTSVTATTATGTVLAAVRKDVSIQVTRPGGGRSTLLPTSNTVRIPVAAGQKRSVQLVGGCQVLIPVTGEMTAAVQPVCGYVTAASLLTPRTFLAPPQAVVQFVPAASQRVCLVTARNVSIQKARGALESVPSGSTVCVTTRSAAWSVPVASGSGIALAPTAPVSIAKL